MSPSSSVTRAAYLRARAKTGVELVARIFDWSMPEIGALIALVGSLVLVNSTTPSFTGFAFAGYAAALVAFAVVEHRRLTQRLSAMDEHRDDEHAPPADPAQTSNLPRWMLDPIDALDPVMLDGILWGRGTDAEDLQARSKKYLRGSAFYVLSPLPVGLAVILFILVFIGGLGAPLIQIPLARAAAIALAAFPAGVTWQSMARFTEYRIRWNTVIADSAEHVVAGMAVADPVFRDGHVVRYVNGEYVIERRGMRPRSDRGQMYERRVRLRSALLLLVALITVIAAIIVFLAHPISGRMIL